MSRGLSPLPAPDLTGCGPERHGARGEPPPQPPRPPDDRAQEQARQTKDATQLGLLTTLNVTAKQAERAINATDAPDLRCEANQVGQLKDTEEAALTEALEFYDYLVWLFEREHVSLKEADRYLAPRMIDAYALGETFFPPRGLASDFRYLKEFRDGAPRAWRPRHPCRVSAAEEASSSCGTDPSSRGATKLRPA
jgi:hypothetical protein